MTNDNHSASATANSRTKQLMVMYAISSLGEASNVICNAATSFMVECVMARIPPENFTIAKASAMEIISLTFDAYIEYYLRQEAIKAASASTNEEAERGRT